VTGVVPRPRIVILDSFAADQGEEAAFWQGLGALGELEVYPRTAEEAVVERLRAADAAFTNKVPLSAADFAALPQLRYVGIMATGTNMIDLPGARAAGVAVTNVPGYATESVAELVFALILQLSHDVAGHSAAVKGGRWATSPDFCFFVQPLIELAGRTLAIVGSGAIGGAVARIAEAFGMKVIRTAVPGSPVKPGSPRTPLTEALPLADVVTLHCPLTESTRGLVGAAFLAAMKPGAILINTSRGGLVDEPALQAALASGHLGGAGLDVLSIEPPPPEHPLTDPAHPWSRRLIVTPHIAWGTLEARHRLAAEVAENYAAFLKGQPRNLVTRP
jgi:glycerate dehydrogenase